MVRREVLLEDEQLVNIIKDSVEERTQQVRLTVDVLHLLVRLHVDFVLVFLAH